METGGQFKVWRAAGGLTPLWGLESVGSGWAGCCRASDPTSFFSSSSPSPSLPGPALHRRFVVSSPSPPSTTDHRPPSPCLTSMDASRPPEDVDISQDVPTAHRGAEQSHSTDGLMLEQIGTWRVTSMSAVRHCCRRHHGSTHRAGYPQAKRGKTVQIRHATTSVDSS